MHIDSAQRTMRTERLLLRPLEASDAPALLRLYGDPEVTQDYQIETLTRLEQAEALLRTYRQFHRRFALIPVGGSELIGTCGYILWDKTSHMASIGYDLARPYWGHGLMREAAAAVLDYGFTVMHLNRVSAQTKLRNVRSMKLLDELGFHEEGVLPQFSYWRDAYHDMRVFSLLRSSTVPVGS